MSEIDPRGARPPGAVQTGDPRTVGTPTGARDRILAARARLARELAVLAGDAAASALERCPYRGRHDACFFGAGCRNRRYDDAGAARCAGGILDTAPAASGQESAREPAGEAAGEAVGLASSSSEVAS